MYSIWQQLCKTNTGQMNTNNYVEAITKNNCIMIIANLYTMFLKIKLFNKSKTFKINQN